MADGFPAPGHIEVVAEDAWITTSLVSVMSENQGKNLNAEELLKRGQQGRGWIVMRDRLGVGATWHRALPCSGLGTRGACPPAAQPQRHATMAWPGRRWTQESFEGGAWLTDQP